METLRRVSIVVAVLLMLVVPLAETSEPTVSGEGTDAKAVSKSGRADEMAAWSVDSGGGESSGGDFSLIAAIGQPDAGQLARGGTVLDGGLWGGAVDLQALFDDDFENGDTGDWSSVVGGTKVGEK